MEQIISVILHALAWVLSAVSGTGFVFIFTNLVKTSDIIPFVAPGQTGRIRTVAGLLAAGSTLLLALVNPDIRPEDTQHAIVTLVTFASTFIAAHYVHKATK